MARLGCKGDFELPDTVHVILGAEQKREENNSEES